MSFTTPFLSFIKAVKDFFTGPSHTPSPHPLTPDEFSPVHSLIDLYPYLSCNDPIFGSPFPYALGFEPWFSPEIPLFSRPPLPPPPKALSQSPSAPSSALPHDPDDLSPSEPPQTPSCASQPPPTIQPFSSDGIDSLAKKTPDQLFGLNNTAQWVEEDDLFPGFNSSPAAPSLPDDLFPDSPSPTTPSFTPEEDLFAQ